MRLQKSIARRSDPIATMMRRPFVSRATILVFFSSMGTTFGVFSMDTAWLMRANKSHSAHTRLGLSANFQIGVAIGW
jgi:hypothetical protein